MLNVGFVGLGHNGLAHIEAHLRLGRSRIVALCDRNAERLRQAGQRFGIQRLYTDERFFDDPHIEAVSIHTGDNDHCDPFVRAMRRGLHVLVEKPLANSEQDVLAMVEAYRRARPSLKVQVGYILRFNPVFEAVHDLARAGRLGDVFYLEGDYVHNLLYQKEKTDPQTGRNWYLEQERPMVGGGSHPLDLLRWISGQEVTRVTGFSNHVAFPEMHNDDSQVALFQFSGGAVAKVAALYAPRLAMPPYYNLRVYGTRGTVERDQVALARDEQDVHPPMQPVQADRVKGHAYEPEIEDWLDAVASDRPTRTGLCDGANSTLASLRACQAIERGSCMDVPALRPRMPGDRGS